MPEIISKHPEIVLQVLKSAGIACGTDTQPKILTHCPKQNFCTLPSGELCVYGINDLPQMTQLSASDFPTTSPTIFSPMNGLLMVSLFLLGWVIGRFVRPKKT